MTPDQPAAAAAPEAPAAAPAEAFAEVQESTSVPEPANLLAQALKNLVLAIAANRKASNGNVVGEIGADVTAAIQYLSQGLSQAGLLDDAVKARPVGCAKGLVIGAMEAAEVLAGEVK